MNSNLRRRRIECSKKLDEARLTLQTEANATIQETDLHSTSTDLTKITASIKSSDTEIESMGARMIIVNQSIDKTRNTLSIDSSTIQQQTQRLEKYLSRKSILLRKKDECTKNIRDLGVLPGEAFRTHEEVDSKKLLDKLHIVNDGLKKFSNVNKKAFEQYNNFTKQRETLNKRKADLDTSAQVLDTTLKLIQSRLQILLMFLIKEKTKQSNELSNTLQRISESFGKNSWQTEKDLSSC